MDEGRRYALIERYKDGYRVLVEAIRHGMVWPFEGAAAWVF